MRSTAEQKNTIIQGILNTENPVTLSEVEEILLLEKPCPAIPAATPENIKESAYKAIEQFKNGQYKTHEEVLEKFSFVYK